MSEDAPRLDRVTSAHAKDRLERLAGSDVLALGGVNLIGFDAICEHLDAHGLGRRPAQIRPLPKAFVEAADGIAPNLIVHGLDGADLAHSAAEAGLTQASQRQDLRFEVAAAAA